MYITPSGKEFKMSFTTRESIVECLQNSREGAWQRFFASYAPLIRLHGSDCGLPPALLDDLVQDVMLSLWRNGRQFVYDREKGRFRDYLRFIIRARAMDILRQNYRERKAQALPRENEYFLDSTYEEEYKEHVLITAMEILSSHIDQRHFQIFQLLDLQHWKIRKVAEFFHLPEQTIYSIRKRTEEKLRRIIRDLDL